MPSDFLFAIELSDERVSDKMLADLTTAVFAYAGLSHSTVEDVQGALRQLRSGGGGAERRLRFQVASGVMTIAVACDGAEWQTTRPLP